MYSLFYQVDLPPDQGQQLIFSSSRSNDQNMEFLTAWDTLRSGRAKIMA
jgi:hypothetical protein